MNLSNRNKKITGGLLAFSLLVGGAIGTGVIGDIQAEEDDLTPYIEEVTEADTKSAISKSVKEVDNNESKNYYAHLDEDMAFQQKCIDAMETFNNEMTKRQNEKIVAAKIKKKEQEEKLAKEAEEKRLAEEEAQAQEEAQAAAEAEAWNEYVAANENQYQEQEVYYEQPAQIAAAQSSTGYNYDNWAKEWIAAHESNGSYEAYNPNGGYYGRYQLNPSLVHYGASPAEQEAAADAYVAQRYGSWENAQSFWSANGWY